MSGERIPLAGQQTGDSFYSGQETSTGEAGTSGISRRILHGLTIISVIIACGCTVYGSLQAHTPYMALPFAVVLIWLLIHFLLLLFARREHHDFHPPAWFLFVSSGNIFIQSLIVIILTL